jgi:hypothetical protein
MGNFVRGIMRENKDVVVFSYASARGLRIICPLR